MKMLRAALALLLCLNVANAQTTLVPNLNSGPPPVAVTPTFIQGTGSDLNDNNGIVGNNFVINAPNATGAGNGLLLSMAYPYNAARTVAIVDSCGDTWPSAAITTGTASASNMNAKTFVLLNASACVHILTVTFDAEIKPFQYTLAEFNNVATASAVDGTQGAANVSHSTADAGSYTPTTNNDANGGHLIWNYAISNDTVGTTSGTQASAIAKRGGVSPSFMHANNISTIPSASSFEVQATNAAINPGFNFTQSSGTNFVVQSVALKAASAGTAAPAGIRVKRLLHLSVVNPVNGNNVMLFPSEGNLLVMTMAAGSNLNAVSSVTDTNGSYTGVSTAGTSQLFYRQNATSGQSLAITINQSGPQFSVHLWDVVGAQASSFLNAVSFNGSAPSSGDITNCPTITPNAAPGLVINQTGSGTASQSAMATGAPAGSVFDAVSYTTSAPLFDQDRMDNADQFGHANYATTAVQHWNFTMTGTAQHGSTLFATAAAFQ